MAKRWSILRRASAILAAVALFALVSAAILSPVWLPQGWGWALAGTCGALALALGAASIVLGARLPHAPDPATGLVMTGGAIGSLPLVWALISGIVRLSEEPTAAVPQLTYAMLVIGGAGVVFDRATRL